MSKIIDFHHLKKVDQAYVPHGWFVIKWGLYLVATGLVSIVHGILPFLWPFKAPSNVLKVAQMIQDRGEDQIIKNDSGENSKASTKES